MKTLAPRVAAVSAKAMGISSGVNPVLSVIVVADMAEPDVTSEQLKFRREAIQRMIFDRKGGTCRLFYACGTRIAGVEC